MSRKCPLPTNREVEEYQRANPTNTPSPTDEDRELIDLLCDHCGRLAFSTAKSDRLESLLADRAKLEEAFEQEISAWAFAHDIDGAIRNDLFARLRGLNRSTGHG